MNTVFEPSTILVTGGAGFIGSAAIRYLLAETGAKVVNVDKLTYAANAAALALFDGHPRYSFEKTCITDRHAVAAILEKYQPDAIMHLAAESHVDRTIDGPATCVETNIIGTFSLLECVRKYLDNAPPGRAFRFHHVSTDEVFGSLGPDGAFSEASPYAPRSPYSASKAASDHLVRAWHATYGIPVILSNCCNNYGPWQFPEKLIPLTIVKALGGQPLPVYGNGDQIRDWLYVDDHAEALFAILTKGNVGESYNVGATCERQNLQVVFSICDLLDQIVPGERRHRELVTFVADRPGHDRRYAIDASRVRDKLGWKPRETFASGLEKTVRWYLERSDWWRSIGNYQGERLGLVKRSAAEVR